MFIAKPFTDYTAEDYATVVGVNLTGFFWLTQRAIAEMATRYGGHVVNIAASIAEVANSRSPSVLTALTKGGLAAATRSLAVEYASRGIRVNAVSPGIIQTPGHPAEATRDSATSCRRSAASARSATSWTPSCTSSRRPISRARSCTSTAARPPATRVPGVGCFGVRGTSAEVPVFDAAAPLEPVSSLRGSVSGFEFGGLSLRALDVADAALLGGRVRAVRAQQAAMTRVDVRSVEFTGCELGSLRWTGGKVSRARLDELQAARRPVRGREPGARGLHRLQAGLRAVRQAPATGPVLFAGCSLREAEFNG